MTWTDVEFNGRQAVNVQIAEIVNVRIADKQLADVSYGNMEPQSVPGPYPQPRRPDNE